LKIRVKRAKRPRCVRDRSVDVMNLGIRFVVNGVNCGTAWPTV
jgi:hypothetical protein